MIMRLYRLFWVLAVLAVVAVAGMLLIIPRLNENWQGRMSAVPLYARSYVRQWQATPVWPTPPPASVIGRARLEQMIPQATPTLAESLAAGAQPPPAADESGAGPSTWSTQATVPPPTATSSPTATSFPLTPGVEYVQLPGVRHVAQTWNNCGPATLTMSLLYNGIEVQQREAAAFLKPEADDKNVSPEQLQAYAQQHGLAAIVRVGGSLELLQRLLSNGFPVIVEDWILPEDRGGMGHYRLLTGYDATAGTFLAQDSYFGPDRILAMAAFNDSWRIFNRKFILIYHPEQAVTVEAIVGPLMDDGIMLANALTTAVAAVQTDPEDTFNWYTLGSTYVQMGEHELAAAAFDEARRLKLPLRMFWYQFDLFEAYLAVGRSQEVIDLAHATAASAGGHEEAYYYEGLAYAAQGNDTVAISRLRQALAYNPNFEPAARALADLTQ